MYIDIARVYFYSQTDYIRQTDIKLTSSNGYKSQKFVSQIDAPYFKNVFAPGASIRRNTVCIVLSSLCILCPMFPVSLDSPFVIAPFSNVNYLKLHYCVHLCKQKIYFTHL